MKVLIEKGSVGGWRNRDLLLKKALQEKGYKVKITKNPFRNFRPFDILCLSDDSLGTNGTLSVVEKIVTRDSQKRIIILATYAGRWQEQEQAYSQGAIDCVYNTDIKGIVEAVEKAKMINPEELRQRMIERDRIKCGVAIELSEGKELPSWILNLIKHYGGKIVTTIILPKGTAHGVGGSVQIFGEWKEEDLQPGKGPFALPWGAVREIRQYHNGKILERNWHLCPICFGIHEDDKCPRIRRKWRTMKNWKTQFRAIRGIED
jgi:hypothetical protein